MKARDETYQYYFYFIQERMKIFWRRFEGLESDLTDDPILAQYKFTNVYRVLDRVSQYLVRHVISEKEQQYPGVDNLLRIIVFKIFNNISTWEYLESRLGEISIKTFDVDRITALLDERIKQVAIFSPAYMMTGSHAKYNMYARKHEKWLRMVEKELLQGKGFEKIIAAKSLEQVYNILLQCSFIGEFLAYQYAIDFNYSSVINFSENSFVKAGIGAIRGIKKCFSGIGHFTFEDCIRYTQDNFEKHQQQYGFTDFKNLFGRPPQLIDLQNCFCETDKYLRVKMPGLLVGNVRIKQKFDRPKGRISFYFPEKWRLNKFIDQNTQGQ
ncbi:nucleotide kinase domain-containing protein [Aridibaculum aurantiacum]|uniref:nucleotide kinase domain-containing protein n=1 Tax=Aridibaculum aurantiacum TaxID=2810307 RepID=UPI001A966ED8|nr:nucleotide kinase domain-containing protein [Aridibaculum aurantiacum]